MGILSELTHQLYLLTLMKFQPEKNIATIIVAYSDNSHDSRVFSAKSDWTAKIHEKQNVKRRNHDDKMRLQQLKGLVISRPRLH